MPRLRAEQIQSLTLTDAQISDGKRYDANLNEIDGFDPMRLIDQSKIRDTEIQPNGWISRGIINRTEALPPWESEYEGRLFYVNSTDELYLAVGTEPWYILISGNTASGWDAELTVRAGIDGLNWNGAMATQFQTVSYTFSPDGTDLFVYLNGSLQRLDHDYEIVDQRTIRMLRNIEQHDTVTMLVILSNSMLNYATKAWVYEQINGGGIQHSLDAAYDDGSIISVDNRDVEWRLQTDKKFSISEAETGVPLPAVHLGTETLLNGHDWQSRWQSFDIVVRSGGNIVGPKTIHLNAPAVNSTEAATEVSESLVSAGVPEVFGFVDNNKIGLQSQTVGSDISFEIVNAANAVPVFGWTTGVYTGADAISSYHEFGVNVDAETSTGLESGQKFWFSVNGTEHFVTTGVGTTYNQLRSLIDTELDASGFYATTEGDAPNQDIRITSVAPGFANPTNVSGVSYTGAIEITQVTTNADVDRSLDGTYFELNSIDASLFGNEKGYYVWYHLDAESEVTRIEATAENSGVTLADSYFTFHTPTNDYFAWYEVETPQTAGYQELGLSGLDSASSSGLTQDTTYYFQVSIDGGTQQEFNFTTNPDIAPTAEITEVTTPADVSQSLTGKYWNLNSQSGTSYYVWYNIDTPAAPEVTEITTTADTNQSLSGKSFSIYTTGSPYYAWMRMMTDPGLTAQSEVSTVETTGDTAQSLSGTYWNLNSADGSQYYVWYEMVTVPESPAVSEITEITAVGDSSQSLSSKYFEIGTPTVDYYVWYRLQTAPPVPGEAESTEISIPGDTSKSLSGKYWTFNTPTNDYYVWYRMEETPAQAAVAQEATFQFTSNTASDYFTQNFDFYQGTTQYTVWFYDYDTHGATPPAGPSVPNPIHVGLVSTDNATSIASSVAGAINAAGIPFSATDNGIDTVTVTWANQGSQSEPVTGDSDIVATITIAGSDHIAAINSTNPSVPGKTGIQVNIFENDSNADVATKTNSAISSNVSSVSTSLSGAKITITNNDNGAVDDASDVDAGVTVLVLNQGVTSQPAQYSANPSVFGKTGIEVLISENETASDVASLTAGVLNSMPQFTASAASGVITVENNAPGEASDAVPGDSGFSVNITQQGQDYIAPTYSTNPSPVGRTGLKVSISEGDDSVTVAEATRAAIDANMSFTAVRSNSVVTVTDNTQGPVADITDGTTGFVLNTTQQGQDYVAPTYTTDPGGAGIGIAVNISENDSSTAVATALESAVNAVAAFSATRVGDVVTITNSTAGAVSDAADVDTGFAISATQQGYDAYSSIDPAVAGRTGIQVNIVENDSAELVASKTRSTVNANANFSASASAGTVTIVDANGGAVGDASDGDAGVTINVTNQGTNLIPADVSWGEILTQLNAATSSAATWSLASGDVRLTSNSIGSWTSVDLASGISGNDLFSNISGFTSFDVAVPGTSSYSAQPAGTGSAVKVAVRENATAPEVAAATQTVIDALPDVTATIGLNAGVDDHIITLTNTDTGAVSDIVDSGTGFVFTVTNQGADESTDPFVASRTGIRVDISKNATANSVAIATASVVDTSGEFYVSRLDNVISIQNDHPGAVTQSVDGTTGFAITRTGLGEDPKYSLFGSNGLNIVLPSAVAGVDEFPADTGPGTQSLTSGFNFYSKNRDFAVLINSDPLTEIFLDEAAYNSSEIVSKLNTKIAGAGITNLEAYQSSGRIGLRTISTGASSTLDLRDSLSDALTTFGWSEGTYTGSFGAADPIFEVYALPDTNQLTIKGDVLPAEHGTYDIGASGNKFKSIHVQEIHVDTGTIYFDESDVEFSIGLGQRATKDSDGTAFPADSRPWEANDIRFRRGDNPGDPLSGKDFFLTAGLTERDAVVPTSYVVPAHQSNSGASKIGVRGLLGIIPKYDIDGNENTENTTQVDSDLQTMMEALALQAGGSCKNFDDFNIWREAKTGVNEETGLGNANLREFFKNRTQIYVRDLEREIRLLKYDPLKLPPDATPGQTAAAEMPVGNGFVGPGQWNSGEDYDQWDWDWLWGRNRPMRGEEFHVVLENLDTHGKPTTGSLTDDSIKLSTTGGIELETGASKQVRITNDLTVEGDLIVNGDTVTVNVSELHVEDNIVMLNKNVSGSPLTDSGIEVERGTETNVSLVWDEDGDLWRAGMGTNLKAIAMRADTQEDGGVAIWNSGESRFDSSSSLDWNGSRLFVDGNVIGNSQIGTEISGFEKVYNAVWNDIADFLPLDEKIEIEYGKVYVRTADGQTRKSASYNEQGILGLASDTYGFGVGRKENWNGTQLPVAIGGFVLAHVIDEYASGTPLTAGEDGVLVEMRIEEKRDYPERIVATYYKPESASEWNGVAVNGRHWVKVKG